MPPPADRFKMKQLLGYTSAFPYEREAGIYVPTDHCTSLHNGYFIMAYYWYVGRLCERIVHVLYLCLRLVCCKLRICWLYVF